MAFDKEEILKKSMEIVQSENPLFIEDLIAYLPCGKTTFYTLFPDGSDELNEIKDAIDVNKIKKKASLRKNWQSEDAAPALQLSLYKLLATTEEHEKLQMNYVDHRTKGKEINPPIQWVDGDSE